MIALLAAALLQAQPAVEPPTSITIRPTSGAVRTVPIERDSSGDAFVRADRLADALRATFGFPAGSAYRARLRLDDVAIEFVAEAPFALVDGEAVPLSAPPHLIGERLLVPIEVVTDLLPRSAPGLLYDAERGELRRFVSTAARAKPSATRAPRREASVADTPPVRSPGTDTAAPNGPPRAAMPAVTPAGPRGRTIVVDAGHGGIDGGMHGATVQEKAVTLAIARRLRETLQARGMGVILTRTRDTLIALADRGRIANQQHGDLFVSIHVNAANPGWRDAAAARGFETYFLAEAKSEDARRVAALENESVQFETAAPTPGSDPLGFILSDMAQNAHLRESSRLAALVQRRLARVHPGPNRGVKQAGFKVLVTASMPAILVEVGYGTNAEDAAFITGDKGQRAIAAAIADAAAEYFGLATPADDSGTTVP